MKLRLRSQSFAGIEPVGQRFTYRATGWLFALDLTTHCNSISTYIGQSPRDRKCCPSLESCWPRRGNSNEEPQHVYVESLELFQYLQIPNLIGAVLMEIKLISQMYNS